MVTAQPPDDSQPQHPPARARSAAPARLGSIRPHDTFAGLPASRLAVFPVSNTLSTLAWEFDQEARLVEGSGGSWAEVLAWGHRRAAAQLRTVVCVLHRHPGVATVRMAQDWAQAAQGLLEEVRGGGRR